MTIINLHNVIYNQMHQVWVILWVIQNVSTWGCPLVLTNEQLRILKLGSYTMSVPIHDKILKVSKIH